MRRCFRIPTSALVPLAVLALVLGTGPDAAALDILDIDVNHINMDDQHPMVQSSAAISAQMTLNFLSPPGTAPSLLDIVTYGQSLSSDTSVALEFGPDVLAAVLNHFSPDPDYNYGVVATDDFSTLVSEVGYWMNRNNGEVGTLPTNAPAMLPLLGSYGNWVVATGSRSETDPYLDPDTAMYGLWLDDPRVNNNGGMWETNIFYNSFDPTANPNLLSALQPMTEGAYDGYHVAVVPMSVVPEPASIVMFGLFGAGMTAMRLVRRKR